MAGNISLEGSIRTCKVDTGYANKIYSDRFLNPCNMVCPQWNGYDTSGRPACPDSFMTKQAGCNSAEDRVYVENYQRPRYVEYVNLDAGGIDGEFYGTNTPNTMNQWDSMKGVSDLRGINCITGNFGQQFGSSVFPNCGVHQYSRAMAQNQETLRKYSALNTGYNSNAMKSTCGF
jgi:hypothetical protein